MKKNNNWKGARIVSDDGEVAMIGLTKGYMAIIDSDSIPVIKDYSWVSMNNHSARHNNTGSIYAYTRRGDRTILMHRLIMNAPKRKQVDHIDGDTLDNRKKNLRLVSGSENMHNMHKMSKPSKHGRGVGKVAWRNSDGIYTEGKNYYAHIKINNRLRYLGIFSTAKEAAKAYEVEKEKMRPKIIKT